MSPKTSKPTLEDAQRDLNHIFNNMRGNKLFAALVGYIWKLEYGEEKGIHIHFIFFFDGSKVHKDAYLAKLIGEYWRKRIVKYDRGIYHNCNMNKNFYKRCGIGMVSHDDLVKRAHLLDAVKYLTKKDQYLRYKPGKKCRAFGKGNMPPERDEGGPGRPRQSDKEE
jgi:hypothetical protein